MNNKNEEDNQENLTLINQQYLKELEANTNIFNQKIKNLNNSLLNSAEKNNSNINTKYNNSSHKKHHLNNSQTIDLNYIKYKYDLNQRDLNTIDINDNNINNYNFKKKGSEKEMRDSNIIEKNKELKKRIKELENENEHKDFLINDLKQKIKENDRNKKMNINYLEYNQLILDIENKSNMIQKLENVIKCLKIKNEKLMSDNNNLKDDNVYLKNKINEVRSKTDSNKLNELNYIKEINELKLENKKLNIEMLNLTNEYNAIKTEKEKLNSLIEEQNNIIYNYQKQLNNNMQTQTLFCDDVIQTENDDNININNSIKKYSDNNYHYKTLDENNYTYNNNYNLTKKKELNVLENYLSNLLKERCKLENELIEVTESPRTLSDIKLKNNINDKIDLNEKEIQNTKNKLKIIRGY